MCPNPRAAHDIFAVPVFDTVLLYSPFHNFEAQVDLKAAQLLRDGFSSPPISGQPPKEILVLLSEPESTPSRKRGKLVPPFLGLIPTRACNLACKYCGFGNAPDTLTRMTPSLVRSAVDWYYDLLCQAGVPNAQVHFFGGEPFCAEDTVAFAVEYSNRCARQVGLTVRFEVATNGTFDPRLCLWAADNLDSVVLSLDGPADIHDRQRPGCGGQSSFEAAARSARLLSDGAADLCLRACITRDSVCRMEEIATWFCQSFRPTSVCFETLQETPESQAAGLCPPDPWLFAQNYIRAARILETYGVEPVYATADIRAKRVTFCPVGSDVVVVSPDGELSACYLLSRDWQAQGLDLRLGKIEKRGNVWLDAPAVESMRALNLLNRPACAHCFCRWHCAGGCPVNHRLSGAPGEYDRLCIQTRTITLSNLLNALGREDLMFALLEDFAALQAAIRQPSDELDDFRTELD